MSEIRHTSVAPTEVRALARGDEVTPHRHDDHQLVYASTGVLEVMVQEGTWFTPSVRAAWVPAGSVHRWQVHGATRVHLVGVPTSTSRRVPRSPVLVAVDGLLRELVIACSERGPAATPADRRLLRVLVDELRPVAAAPTMLPVLRDARLRDVQAILERDMTASPTLAELGHRVGASERTLSRRFHDELGMGFTTWRTQLRLHRATLLLAEGHTVTQVAGDCGFSSPSAFVSTFRAAFGRTPGSLRR